MVNITTKTGPYEKQPKKPQSVILKNHLLAINRGATLPKSSASPQVSFLCLRLSFSDYISGRELLPTIYPDTRQIKHYTIAETTLAYAGNESCYHL